MNKFINKTKVVNITMIVYSQFRLQQKKLCDLNYVSLDVFDHKKMNNSFAKRTSFVIVSGKLNN